jgi:hypothetical protein
MVRWRVNGNVPPAAFSATGYRARAIAQAGGRYSVRQKPDAGHRGGTRRVRLAFTRARGCSGWLRAAAPRSQVSGPPLQRTLLADIPARIYLD